MARTRGRRRLRYGLLVGTLGALAGAAYRRRRSRIDRTPTSEAVITERHATAFLADRAVDPTRVDELGTRVSQTLAEADPSELLGVDGASTATLFLDRGGAEPILRWYVELPRSVVDAWNDPDATIDEAFPIAHDALEPMDEPIDRELVVHAVNPSRPRSIAADDSDADPNPDADRESGSLLVAADRDESGVDVELVRTRLESGFPERFADWFAELSRRVVAGDLDLDRVQSWSAEMLDAEEMYTESIFLERGADGYAALQYMEARDMRQVYDAYYATWNPVARLSELLLGRLLEEPSRILQYPFGSDIEPLAHAIAPDRPRRVADCRAAGVDD
ncbi:DUF6176 family protein [Halosolutus gelatinilyticus]|uniref:DUF6176 family protein n=1 Tax=Halosolutus gelatinilyticus TaxID=2931975 RepID=UPI001FF52BA4|nr:DUF6176 family protein [Halosolutus gelatinilyticus]